MEKLKHKGLIIFILGLLSAIGPLSIDMYLPGFNDIADSLHTDIDQVGYSLSSFFIGISIGQLIYGPLLDRFGKKPPLYIGLILYIITSIIITFIVDVNSLIVLRFFQALGSCAGMVGGRALVRDLFPVEENAKVFSYLMLVIAVSPLFAPTLGGFITNHIGWQAIFVVLAIFSFSTLIATYFWVPKGMPPNTEMSLKPKPIVKSFLRVMKVPKFYTYGLISAISSSGLYAYIAGSPNLFMNIYEVSKRQYGWIFAIIGMGMTIASQINTLLLRKFKSEQISIVAMSFQVLTGLILVITTYFGWLNLYTNIALIWLYLFTQGAIYPNTSALCLAPFNLSAGTASALMGALQLGIGALATALVNAFTDTTAMPMVITMLLCGSISFIILFVGRRFIQDDPQNQKIKSPGVKKVH